MHPLSTHPCTHLPTHSFTCLSTINPPTHPSTYLSIHPSTLYPFTHLPIHCLSIYPLHIRLSIHLLSIQPITTCITPSIFPFIWHLYIEASKHPDSKQWLDGDPHTGVQY